MAKKSEWEFEKTQRLELRVSEAFFRAIDEWRLRQRPDPPSRSEAVRRLVELGLKKAKHTQ
jgi:hypothetical protein